MANGFPVTSEGMLLPKVSIPRRMPTSRPRSPVRVPLGAPNEPEQSNKQSTHALLIKTPLGYSSLFFSAAGLCRSRLSRRPSLLDPAAASPSPLLLGYYPRLLVLRSASWRHYPVPPRGAFRPIGIRRISSCRRENPVGENLRPSVSNIQLSLAASGHKTRV